MRNGRGLLLILSTLLVLGCNDDKDSEEAQAQDACFVFGETWCERSLNCLVEVGTIEQSAYAANYNACADIATKSCDSAVSVRSTYDQCLLDINAMPCSSWAVPVSELSNVSIPATCNGVILTQ